MVELKRHKKSKTDEAVKSYEAAMKPPPEEEPEECRWIDPYYLIPTGSTLLNCALSDHYQGGYQIGTIANTIGDTQTGKTLLALNCLAEMSLYKRFDDYRFIFDDAETTLANNIRIMFGVDVAQRIELDRRSDTVQDLYANLLRAIRDGRPFVYLMDSLDALTSREEQGRASKLLKAKEKEEETGNKIKEDGSYKMEKAKLLSEILRVITREIKDKEAFVNIISQTRDNIGWGFTDKTRSGGRALEFYAYHVMWASPVGQITKEVNKKKEKIGNNSEIKVSKNKLTFKKRAVTIPIYDNFGIDDIGSCIDFLVDQGIWKKNKQTIIAEHFGWEGVRENIIRRIEVNNGEQELSRIVGNCWCQKEDALTLDRKRRYK